MNLDPSVTDRQLWIAMNNATYERAVAPANGQNIDTTCRNQVRMFATKIDVMALEANLPHAILVGANPNGRCDCPGPTHHVAVRTLRMEDDPDTSIPEAHRRFHQVSNTYAVRPCSVSDGCFPQRNAHRDCTCSATLRQHLISSTSHPVEIGATDSKSTCVVQPKT